MVARAKSGSPPIKIMKKSEIQSSSNFVEETAFGENLQIGCFDDTFKKFFAYSGGDVISFNVDSGERIRVYRHKGSVVIGVYFQDNLLLSFTNLPQYFLWNVDNGDQIASINIQLPSDQLALWTYNFDGKYFILAQSIENTKKSQVKTTKSSVNENQESSLFEILQLNTTQNSSQKSKVSTRLVAQLENTPPSKAHLAVYSGFFVKCEKRIVKIYAFGEDDEEENEDENLANGTNEDEEMEEHVKGGSNSAVKLPKRREYHIDAKFDVVDQNLVEFKEVVIAGNSLYAVLNIGRVYCWTDFTTRGLSTFNLSHFTLSGYEPTICVSDIGTSFIGFGNAQLYKYNLTASSGVGRWISHEHLLLESPPRSLLLCGDFTKMAVLLRDNTLCFISTAQMQLISRAEVLHVLCLPEQYNNENYRFSITNDPALENELLFVANARLGHIQWVDPLCWQTTCILDIAEENGPPPQDTFNMPKFQWLNTYLVCLSMQMLVSCESGRDNPEKTLIKFWRRSKSKSLANASFKLENCVELLDKRIKFLRSTFDEFTNIPSSSNANEMELSVNNEEFIFVYSTGLIDIYKRDASRRSSHWSVDLKRRESNWQRCLITSCSKVRQRLFATIQILNDSTFIVLRNVDEMKITRVIDNLVDAKQVEWSHSPNILIVLCASGLVAFNCKKENQLNPLWIIKQPNFVNLGSSRSFTFTHNGQEVHLLNPEDGTINNFMEDIRFSHPQKRIIALQKHSKDKRICNNIYFCGINDQGSFTLISPKLPSIEEKNQIQMEEENCNIINKNLNKKIKSEKQTAFSRLVEIDEEKKIEKKKRKNKNNEEEEEEDKSLKKPRYLLKQVSIKKIIDGPAYTLPSISVLAQRFVQACLVRRRS
ncbi:unnamed protein product [Meloidogyne enterolobii]|uniref:Uncharacterized protein n=1 Tax=Meloidogyne enterolobii TaxID=390850 RepID=A0ACB0XPV5_MELEN